MKYSSSALKDANTEILVHLYTTTGKACKHPESTKTTSNFLSPRILGRTESHHHQGIPTQTNPLPQQYNSNKISNMVNICFVPASEQRIVRTNLIFLMESGTKPIVELLRRWIIVASFQISQAWQYLYYRFYVKPDLD